ncbi:MAG: hypothetical protein HKN14_01600 [Marinicaulis sp.]|nr:hypothetical protein [Marinicaulis sp.]NNE39592.1 hypothetical protein [Marinicaulis sp.]NNL88470.1 hypothetical protein [Marinicaulis sp.]
MSVLEKAILNLAEALDDLEGRIEGGADKSAAKTDQLMAAHKQARVAREHTEEAARDLSISIKELHRLLETDDDPAGADDNDKKASSA